VLRCDRADILDLHNQDAIYSTYEHGLRSLSYQAETELVRLKHLARGNIVRDSMGSGEQGIVKSTRRSDFESASSMYSANGFTEKSAHCDCNCLVQPYATVDAHLERHCRPGCKSANGKQRCREVVWTQILFLII
jgi:hypothetical protein